MAADDDLDDELLGEESPAESFGDRARRAARDAGVPGRGIPAETFRNAMPVIIAGTILLTIVFFMVNPDFIGVVILLGMGGLGYAMFMYGEKDNRRAFIGLGVLFILLGGTLPSLPLVGGLFVLDPLLGLAMIIMFVGLGAVQRGYTQNEGGMATIGAIMVTVPAAFFLFISGMPIDLMLVFWGIAAAILSGMPSGLKGLYDIFNLTTAAIWVMSMTNAALTVMAGDVFNLGFAAMAITAATTSVFMFMGDPPHIFSTLTIISELLGFVAYFFRKGGGGAAVAGAAFTLVGFLLFVIREGSGASLPFGLTGKVFISWMAFFGAVLTGPFAIYYLSSRGIIEGGGIYNEGSYDWAYERRGRGRA